MNDGKNKVLDSDKLQLSLATGEPGYPHYFLSFNNTQKADKRNNIRKPQGLPVKIAG